MTEIWKDIEDYEGKYEVSNLGRIKSLKRLDSIGKPIKERILKSSSWHGYLKIRLCKNGKTHSFRINRLVAIHFVANPDSKPQVNHIDGNKTNNSVTNLEWNNSSENLTHASKNGLLKPFSKLTKEEVKSIRALKDKGISQENIGKMFNISRREVGYIHNKKCWVNI